MSVPQGGARSSVLQVNRGEAAFLCDFVSSKGRVASDLHVRVWGSDVEAQVNGQCAESGDGAGVGSVSGSLEEAVLEDHNRTRDGQMEERAERHQLVHGATQADGVVPQVGSKVLQTPR